MKNGLLRTVTLNSFRSPHSDYTVIKRPGLVPIRVRSIHPVLVVGSWWDLGVWYLVILHIHIHTVEFGPYGLARALKPAQPPNT